MRKIQNVYISGIGAVGASCAAKLFDMDPVSVKVIADGEQIDRYKSQGITINDKVYSFDYIHPQEATEAADLIIIAVKQHHLQQSMEDIGPFVGEHTIILSLLNGIISEEVIGKKFGEEKLLHSFCVGTDATREGTVIHYTKIGEIVFGQKGASSLTPNVAAVKELFDRASIPYRIPKDIIQEQWWKFLMNVGLNQISALLRAPYGTLGAINEAKELLIMASREVVSIAQKAGIDLSKKDIHDYIEVVYTLSPQGKTSMLQDVEAHRKTEVEIFSGSVTELGRKYGVPTPINDFLYRALRVIEQTY